MGAGRFAVHRSRSRRPSAEADLIRRLRELPAPTPEAQFKSELRAQLVAITSRVVSESATSPAAAPPAGVPVEVAVGTGGARARGGALRAIRRPVLALAGASTVLVLLLAMAVWISGGSLPGQSLYGVKRASENVHLSLAGNDTEKGRTYLQFAAHRAQEAADLLSKPSAMLAGGGISAGSQRISPHTASLVTDTLASADADSRSGMQLLGRAAVAQLSKDPLAGVSNWLPGQRARLAEVRNRIPAGALRNRAQASLTLLQRITTRTKQLSSKMGCPCLAQALSDELGPLPCDKCGSVPNRAPGGSAAASPGLNPTGGSGPLPSLSLPALGGGSGSGTGSSSSGNTVASNSRSGNAGSGNVGSGNAGSRNAGPGNAGSASSGPGRSGSGNSSSGQAAGSVPGTPVTPPTVPVLPSGALPSTGLSTPISAGPITVSSGAATISLPSVGPVPSISGASPSLPLPLPSVTLP
jgi:hypothetical protein